MTKHRFNWEFEEGYSSYWLGDYDTALVNFANVLSVNPDDKAAQIYVQRCEYHRFSQSPEADGVPDLSRHSMAGTDMLVRS